eukprot:TRINITY_DN3822_c0_g1_i1.p5 TRINITY_DN3822_c0_g1~~TRINITY_DN3822_c0_g1_i1.p5  ORF type:complete len:118 (+),score=3.65 TRINITY_DN3822_c0_g1_i1:301-654(+)
MKVGAIIPQLQQLKVAKIVRKFEKVVCLVLLTKFFCMTGKILNYFLFTLFCVNFLVQLFKMFGSQKHGVFSGAWFGRENVAITFSSCGVIARNIKIQTILSELTRFLSLLFFYLFIL